MFRNYIKVAIRNLWKNKVFSSINVFGLAAGMACSLLIFLFVTDETSYDRYNKDAGNIYRIVKDFVNDDGSKIPDATTPPALAPAMQKEIPGIVSVTRVFPGWGGSWMMKYGDKKIQEEKLLRVDSSFFDVFSFPFIRGNAKNAFRDLNSIVLTESAAQRYFGKENPMGKVISADNLGDMMVTGVLKDVPSNSHFHFDFLISVRKLGGNVDGNWTWYNFYTYAKVKEHTSPSGLTNRIQALYKKNNDEGANIFYVQPLTDIHLTSNLKWELEPNGDKHYVKIFTLIGLFILLIAAINYINLATAKSSLRAKEIGVRKVSGAVRSSLVNQFLIESAITCIIAAFFAIIIAQLMLPVVNLLTGKQLTVIGNPEVILYVFTGSLIIGLTAGIFPALYLSSFRPILVLKGLRLNESGALLFRKMLVVIQFAISIGMIIGALIIAQQMNFIRSARLGLNKDHVVVVKNAYFLSPTDRNAFINSISTYPGIAKASTSDGVLGGQNWTNSMRARGSENEQLINFLTVGYDYLQVLGIELKEGRGFSKSFPADTMNYNTNFQLDQTIGSVVLNETALKDMGIKSPAVGKQIVWGSDGDTTYYLDIIGVARDFHFTSMRNQIKPFAFVTNPNRQWNFTVKLTGDHIPATLAMMEKTWKQFSKERPFEYNFLDETFASLYSAEARFQKVFISLVILGILIACLGLLGLATFAAQQRVKEIGIRKVLGATVSSVVALLSKDFLKLVLIAFLIALPFAWWAMNLWLQDFAYRIEIRWWIFPVAGLIALVIAFFTISFQAIRAAVANPVKNLRTE